MGATLIKNGKSNRIGEYLKDEKEREDFMSSVYSRIVDSIKEIPDIIDNMIFVFDTFDTKCFRYQIFSEYKANRKKHHTAYDYQSFKQCQKDFMDFLAENGINTIEIPRLEADDIIGKLCEISIEKKQNSIILTGDSDLKQLLHTSKNCCISMYDMDKKIVFVSDDFNINKIVDNSGDEFGGIMSDDITQDKIIKFFQKIDYVNSKQQLLTKVISGDKGDNISSCMSYVRGTSTMGVTDKRMDEIFKNNEFDDIEISWDYVEKKIVPALNEVLKTKKILDVFPDPKKFIESFNINKKLIDICSNEFDENDIKNIIRVFDMINKNSRNKFLSIKRFESKAKDWDENLW